MQIPSKSDISNSSVPQSAQVMNTTDMNAHENDQYLTFMMAGEEYGVDILCVQEIRGWDSATPIPNAPPHVKGVINLRGTIVPIIDLRQCFNMPAISYTPLTVVIVLKVQTSSGSRIMGIVVDAVSDVYALAASDMRSVPDLGNAANVEFIRSLVSVNDKMIILLDIDKLLVLDQVPALVDGAFTDSSISG
ncbi:chemotaxis protein CheW [Teredinibacter waterburyi]|jgi:Chemotaxis signal transduction protein|uniref:chemotaxis protein CheW n=1 Tax=Teredinibacter waterburyi TaxID=1500538 RepID=UPI00165F2E72|nr:chemotaxis protein CheW [Teredinibacter waterburyi]